MVQHGKNIHYVSHPDYYNNRELSWLRFNQRVLEEALNPNNPQLEKLRFVSIFSSNLDEFFMTRVAGLQDQVRADYHIRENKAGMTPHEQLVAISNDTHQLVEVQRDYYTHLMKQLKIDQIEVKDIKQLSAEQQDWLETYFTEQIFPSLTPLAIDLRRPFPLLANLSLNIAVCLTSDPANEPTKLAIIQLPDLLKRTIQICDTHHYVFVEELITHFVDTLFIGYQVTSATFFRITRNADMTIHEEDARDLLKVIESELHKREWGAVVRLEVASNHFDPTVVRFLQSIFEIDVGDIYYQRAPLDLTFLNDFYQQLQPYFKHLIYPIVKPQPAKELDPNENILDQIKQKDILLHHPYDAFDPVIDFIQTAANDPNVVAIKQTLYRVSEKSPIINHLERAAKAGKQVTVLVELKARFDEQNNVHWAKTLERAGCQVIYGVSGLKTHSKICLVVRKGPVKIERYVHLGTGNYNEQTATLYTDIGLFSAREGLVNDATHFFNLLSGVTKAPTFNYFSIAPNQLRDDFLTLIDREIEYQQQFSTGHIIAKMNALTDKTIIMKLYQASQAGVEIDLIVRGICCLKPGIPGISEHIRVHSIVGRFLEHSRIYYFFNNGDEAYYLSSADWMTRNLQRRIELLFPILQTNHKQRIKKILEISLKDNTNRRQQNMNGHYYSVARENEQSIVNSQLTFKQLAYQRE